MPSGAKKRKAAKRKKEEEMGIHHPPPHSSTNTPQGNSREESENSDHHLTEEEVEMESSDSGRGEAKGIMVAGERGEVVDETNTSDVDVYEVKEMGIEYVEAKMEDNGSGAHLEEEPSPAEVSSEVVLQQSVAPLTEEEVEVPETMAASAADKPLPEEEHKEEPPPTSTVGSVQIHDIERSEIAVTTEVAPAPLLEHRTSLWNCCGLLDVLKGDQR